MGQQLGKMIKKLRKIKSLSQVALAQKAGLSQSFLSDIESGQKSPTIRSLKKIAEALDVLPDQLLSTELNPAEKIDQENLLKRREMEEKINRVIGKFYKKVVGHGPKSLKTRVFENIVVIRYQQYTSPLLDHLLKSEKGKEVYKNLLEVIFENCKGSLINILNETVGSTVTEIYFDGKITSPEMLTTIIFKDNLLK